MSKKKKHRRSQDVGASEKGAKGKVLRQVEKAGKKIASGAEQLAAPQESDHSPEQEAVGQIESTVAQGASTVLQKGKELIVDAIKGKNADHAEVAPSSAQDNFALRTEAAPPEQPRSAHTPQTRGAPLSTASQTEQKAGPTSTAGPPRREPAESRESQPGGPGQSLNTNSAGPQVKDGSELEEKPGAFVAQRQEMLSQKGPSAEVRSSEPLTPLVQASPKAAAAPAARGSQNARPNLVQTLRDQSAPTVQEKPKDAVEVKETGLHTGESAVGLRRETPSSQPPSEKSRTSVSPVQGEAVPKRDERRLPARQRPATDAEGAVRELHVPLRLQDRQPETRTPDPTGSIAVRENAVQSQDRALVHTPPAGESGFSASARVQSVRPHPPRRETERRSQQPQAAQSSERPVVAQDRVETGTVRDMPHDPVLRPEAEKAPIAPTRQESGPRLSESVPESAEQAASRAEPLSSRDQETTLPIREARRPETVPEAAPSKQELPEQSSIQTAPRTLSVKDTHPQNTVQTRPAAEAGRNDRSSPSTQRSPEERQASSNRDKTSPSRSSTYHSDPSEDRAGRYSVKAREGNPNELKTSKNVSLQTSATETGANQLQTQGASLAAAGQEQALHTATSEATKQLAVQGAGEAGAAAASGAATGGVTAAVELGKKVVDGIKDTVQNAVSESQESGTGYSWLVCLLLVPLLLIVIMGGSLRPRVAVSNPALTPWVAALRPIVERWCSSTEKNEYGVDMYNIPDYVPLVMAMIMQESGGVESPDHPSVNGDVMQCAESKGAPPAHLPVPGNPNPTLEETIEESIRWGVHLIALKLRLVGCTGPEDITAIQYALQCYNYGDGFYYWSRSRGGYSMENAEQFAVVMSGSVNGYGDRFYPEHVLRFYNVNYTYANYGGSVGLPGVPDGYFSYPYTEGWITYNNSDGSHHSGIDVQLSMGTPVYAAADGVVSSFYYNNSWTEASGRSGLMSYGNYVGLTHDNGWLSIYAHLSTVMVVQGQHVTQGQLLGYSGTTGNSSGPHMHFELRNSSGTPYYTAGRNYAEVAFAEKQ